MYYSPLKVNVNSKIVPVAISVEKRWKRPPTPMSDILNSFSTVSYYLCVSPYRLQFDGESAKFVGHSWKPQRIVCASIYLFCAIRYLTLFRLELSDLSGNQKNPVEYFHVVEKAADIINGLCIMKSLWFESKAVINALNKLGQAFESKSGTELNTRTTTILQLIYYGMHACIVTLIIIDIVKGCHLSSSFQDCSLQSWGQKLIIETRYTFFYGKSPRGNGPGLLDNTTWIDIILGIVTFASIVSERIWVYYTDIFLLCLTLTLWRGANCFAEQADYHCVMVDVVKTSTTEIWLPDANLKSEFWQKLGNLRDGSDEINRSIGAALIWAVVDALMYHSVHLDDFTTKGIFHQIQQCTFVLMMSCTLYFGADIQRKIEKGKRWVEKVKKENNLHEMVNLITYLNFITCDIGIKGSGFFTITFAFMATYFSTMVTFFIICVQQKP